MSMSDTMSALRKALTLGQESQEPAPNLGGIQNAMQSIANWAQGFSNQNQSQGAGSQSSGSWKSNALDNASQFTSRSDSEDEKGNADNQANLFNPSLIGDQYAAQQQSDQANMSNGIPDPNAQQSNDFFGGLLDAIGKGNIFSPEKAFAEDSSEQESSPKSRTEREIITGIMPDGQNAGEKRGTLSINQLNDDEMAIFNSLNPTLQNTLKWYSDRNEMANPAPGPLNPPQSYTNPKREQKDEWDEWYDQNSDILGWTDRFGTNMEQAYTDFRLNATPEDWQYAMQHIPGWRERYMSDIENIDDLDQVTQWVNDNRIPMAQLFEGGGLTPDEYKAYADALDYAYNKANVFYSQEGDSQNKDAISPGVNRYAWFTQGLLNNNPYVLELAKNPDAVNYILRDSGENLKFGYAQNLGDDITYNDVDRGYGAYGRTNVPTSEDQVFTDNSNVGIHGIVGLPDLIYDRTGGLIGHDNGNPNNTKNKDTR